MFREDVVESFLVPDVQVHTFWPLATDELYAVNGHFRRIVEIVRDNDFVPSFEKRKGGKGANVASAPAMKP